MKEVPDKTGRFRKRPFYEEIELDLECDDIITKFMEDSYGDLIFPIPTDALTKLIERDAGDLDLYADLTGEGPDVEGVTHFFMGKKPKVLISRELSENAEREFRLRTTLTHEYGHVRFHDYLWQIEDRTADLFPKPSATSNPKCLRQNMVKAPKVDWMEWQAGFVCGALLMPRRQVQHLVDAYFTKNDLLGSVAPRSMHAVALQGQIVKTFHVSREAAEVRLSVLGTVSE